MSRSGLSVKVAGNAFDPSGSWVEADIKSGSITPSTHVERFFEKDFSDSVFVDSFLSGNGKEVLGFGINTLPIRARIGAAGAGSGVVSAGAVAIAGSGGVGVPSDKSYPVLDSMDKIQKLPAILAIQRGGGMGKNWYDETDFPVRVRQSSDPRVSAVFYKIGKEITKNLKLMELISVRALESLLIQTYELLSTSENDRCIPKIIELNQFLIEVANKYQQTRHDAIASDALSLIGGLEMNETEE